MADIHVIYPKGGAPIVRNEGEFMSSGEMVTWCLHTDDPGIKTFEVEFADPTSHRFFKGHNPEHRFNRGVQNNRAEFYGHVPDYPGSTSSVIAKYSVRGLDAAGGPVFEVDPVIITPKP